jgi:hypothetical protein
MLDTGGIAKSMDWTIRLEGSNGCALMECHGVPAHAAVRMLQRLLGVRARIEKPGYYGLYRDGECVAVLKVVEKMPALSA